MSGKGNIRCNQSAVSYHLQDRQKISQLDSFQLQTNRKTIFKRFHSNQMYCERAPLSFPDGEHRVSILVHLRELCVPKKSGHWKRRELSSGLALEGGPTGYAKLQLFSLSERDWTGSSSSCSLLSVKLIGWNQRLNKVLKAVSVTLYLHATLTGVGGRVFEIFCLS